MSDALHLYLEAVDGPLAGQRLEVPAWAVAEARAGRITLKGYRLQERVDSEGRREVLVWVKAPE